MHFFFWNYEVNLVWGDIHLKGKICLEVKLKLKDLGKNGYIYTKFKG